MTHQTAGFGRNKIATVARPCYAIGKKKIGKVFSGRNSLNYVYFSFLCEYCRFNSILP